MRRFYIRLYTIITVICVRAKRDFNELHYIQILHCLCARKTYLSFVTPAITPAVQTTAAGVARIAGVYVAEGFTVNRTRLIVI